MSAEQTSGQGPTLVGETYRDAWRADFGERGCLWHVRGVVDDMLIARAWSKGKQQWHYAVIHLPAYRLTIGSIREPTPKLRAWLESLAEDSS